MEEITETTETTLYDAKGHAVAYIVEDGQSSIYLWDGHAVAYLVDENKVYGWNGQHLGWFEEGIMRDIEGKKVGFFIDQCPAVPKMEKTKKTKNTKRLKATQKVLKARRSDKELLADTSLDAFLRAGQRAL
ncbi:MAG TPA: hypothetical protein VIR63_06135 [Pontiella sp.]